MSKGKALNPCTVAGCTKQANRIKYGLCEAHYMRLRRNGTTDTVVSHKDSYKHSGGYINLHKPGHPLSINGMVYEHRYVYFEAFGIGPFNCHVCNKQLNWDNLHIDHLNDDKTDNRIDNLKPACPTCNQERGRHKMVAKMREQGRVITFAGKTMCLSEWARDLKLSRAALQWRLEKGWALDKALRPRTSRSGPQNNVYRQVIV